MSHKPTRKHSTSNLPDAKQGDIAFHTDTLKPMFWNNGWHQFDNEYRGPVDLFIIAGQSNAHGHALISGLNDDQIITNDVMFHTSWHQDTSDATTTQYYSDWVYDVTAGATRGDNNESTLDSTQFGPELGFARRAKNLTSTRAKIGIVKHAIGASQLTAGDVGLSDWDMGEYADDVREGDALRAWKRTMDDATAKLTALNITYRWKGMIWWQGESGTNTTNVQLLWQHMRDYLNAPDMAIVATRLGYGTANTWTDASVFTNTSNVAVVDATEFNHSGEVNHVGHDGGADPRDMFNIGMEYANKFAELFVESPIAKIDQTILFPGQPSKDQAAGTHTITNVSTSSGLPVTFTSSDTSVATIAGNVVTMLTPGTITITATQAGDNTHNPVTATQTFQITDGLWTPDYDSGVAGWWDASDTSTLTIDSGTGQVTQWRDKTDNDADFVPWHGEAAQSTETVGETTLDTIHMNDDSFTTATLTTTQAENLGLTTDSTKQKDLIWYFVARADPSVVQTVDNNNNESLFQFGGTTSTQAGTRQFILLNTNNNAKNNLYWYNLAGGVTTTANTSNTAFPAATSPDFFMIGTRLNTPGGTISTWQGGGAVVVDKNNPADPPDTGTTLKLNRYQKTLEGEWGEIVVSSSTDETSRQRMEGYLAHKWGLDAKLPADHPYKSEAP